MHVITNVIQLCSPTTFFRGERYYLEGRNDLDKPRPSPKEFALKVERHGIVLSQIRSPTVVLTERKSPSWNSVGNRCRWKGSLGRIQRCPSV
jgi:hypothetical protein